MKLMISGKIDMMIIVESQLDDSSPTSLFGSDGCITIEYQTSDIGL